MENLSVIATISEEGVEALQLHLQSCKGTVFAGYMSLLIEHLKAKYPKRSFTIIMDNLRAHKTTQVLKTL